MYTEAQLTKGLFTYLRLINRKIKYSQSKEYITNLINGNGYAYAVDLLKSRYPNIDFVDNKHLISDTQYERDLQMGLFDDLPEVVI